MLGNVDVRQVNLAFKVGGLLGSRCHEHRRGMSPREAVELLIAGIALKAGLFRTAAEDATIVPHLSSSIVMMAIVTTVVSPIILKRSFVPIPAKK